MQAKLVARTPRGIDLTSVGSAVLKHVYPLRLARVDVTREAADLSRGSAGDLRIGASPGFGEHLLPEACSALFSGTQKVTVNVSVTVGATTLLEAVRKGELDLVICVAPTSVGEGLVKEALYDDEYVVYVSRHHRFAKRKRVSLADIAQEHPESRVRQSQAKRCLTQELTTSSVTPNYAFVRDAV
jgi:LysR family hydrogen peroxide-inducible transcriptional activator